MAEKEIKNISAKEEKPAKAKKNANEKPGFFKRIAAWFKSVKSEFKKVTWASRKSTFKNFGIVMAIVVASAVVIGVVDLGLGAFLNLLHKYINV